MDYAAPKWSTINMHNLHIFASLTSYKFEKFILLRQGHKTFGMTNHRKIELHWKHASFFKVIIRLHVFCVFLINNEKFWFPIKLKSDDCQTSVINTKININICFNPWKPLFIYTIIYKYLNIIKLIKQNRLIRNAKT